jgi:polyphosphate kinase
MFSNKQYINRDKSWLQFNNRVLQEAADPTVPLIERIRFLGIHSNNLDEFFRVRYASIRRLAAMSGKKVRPELGGYSAKKLLGDLTDIVIAQQKRSQDIYDELMDELKKRDILVVDENNLTTTQRDFVRKYYVDKVSPAIFNLILSDKRPFPELKDKSIYLAIKFLQKDKNNEPLFALIEIPTELVGRFVILPKYGKHYIMYLDDLIRYNLAYVYFTFKFDHVDAHTIKITRDAEIDIDDDMSKSVLEKIQKGLKERQIADPVRFVFDKTIPEDVLNRLITGMKITQFDSLIAGGKYHNKKDLMKFPNVGGPELEHEDFQPVPHPDLEMDRSLIKVVAKKDVLIFMPYHSFSLVIRFLREAAIDPHVTEIKITLYRLASDSRIVSGLINAAKNGKDVTVVVELQARFDEENNIYWTNRLRAEGVKVISGVPGLKVHSKIALIRRVENNKGRDFAIVGTGNFHEGTARLYTDYQMITADKRITAEVRQVFEFLQANYLVYNYKHLIVSPHHTRNKFEELIDNEIENAKKGLPSGIFLKMNSLSDISMINKLYEANQYGVKIKLIVRGICSLIPQVPGLSENIEAISVIDRYLEHSRVYVFENSGEPKYFLSSADWMTRNIDLRVEVTVPVYDKNIQMQLRDHLEIIWKDNVKSRYHNAAQDNCYKKIPGPRIRSQIEMYNYVTKIFKKNQLP